jgi:glycosyltransferase involved in cell wall biosynthesis
MTARLRVSIILPVHNGEQYLNASCGSALAQSFDDLEIIIVDDGSTDGSRVVANSLANISSRVKVISNESNRGASAARNTGITHASGDWLFFLDADDTIPPKAIEILHAAAEQTDADLAIGTLTWIRNPGDVEYLTATGEENGTVKATSMAESKYLQTIPGCHCCNLYKRSLLNEENIRYPEDLALGEDQLFQAHALIKARVVAVTSSVVYHYHHYRSESLTRQQPTLDDLLDDIEYQVRIFRLFENDGLPDAARRFITRWSYSIKEYWIKMPDEFPSSHICRLFDAFRTAIADTGVNPVSNRIPAAHARLMELVLSHHDTAAIAQLRALASDDSSQ